jgi:hypothetical protein
MADALSDRLRSLLAADVYSSKGRLRADDLLVLNADRGWDRVRGVGLDELMQFDWALVGESDGLATDLAGVAELDAVDAPAAEGRLRRIRDLMGERRRYLEIQA